MLAFPYYPPKSLDMTAHVCIYLNLRTSNKRWFLRYTSSMALGAFFLTSVRAFRSGRTWEALVIRTRSRSATTKLDLKRPTPQPPRHHIPYTKTQYYDHRSVLPYPGDVNSRRFTSSGRPTPAESRFQIVIWPASDLWMLQLGERWPKRLNGHAWMLGSSTVRCPPRTSYQRPTLTR
jgi:hypothetical protein